MNFLSSRGMPWPLSRHYVIAVWEAGYSDGGETVVFDGEGYLCRVCVDAVFDEFFESGVDVEDELTARDSLHCV